jgi:hypothetical protein
VYNIYCDESCHLPNDGIDIMVLGAICCPEEKKNEIYSDIRDIKASHGINSKSEIKWTKVSKPKIELYEQLIDYFFNNDDLQFRAVVAMNKSNLDHAKYNDNDHDLWYYKMYFYLLDRLCLPNKEYKIYVDIKDTRGGPRTRKLHDVLCNNKYDFKRDSILDVQQINSSRADLLQLTDLLIGALAFYHRGLCSNGSLQKRSLVERLESYVGQDINGTPSTTRKFNVFIWNPRG